MKKRKIKKRKKRLFSKKDHANKSKTAKTTNEDEMSLGASIILLYQIVILMEKPRG
jgi:hypothetical protein